MTESNPLQQRLREARQEQQALHGVALQHVKTGLEVEFGFQNVEIDTPRNDRFLVNVSGTIFFVTVAVA